MNVVVSSRSRIARNVQGYGFSTYANKEQLIAVAELINKAINNIEEGNDFIRIPLPELEGLEKNYLTESRLISKEMEQNCEFCYVYLSHDRRISVMINEEDHIRMQCLLPGLQLRTTYEIINLIDNRLSESLDYAFSEKFGYLTACPTNTGTGLRLSVMVHLPALGVMDGMKEIVEVVQPLGIAIRGFQGENSNFIGDFYQISNETSLGKTEEELLDNLLNVIEQIISREEEARSRLFEDRLVTVQDVIWRSFAVLSHARRIDSMEALQLLSRIRLGIDLGLFEGLSHRELNRLIVDIQPAHLQVHGEETQTAENRDIVRAAMLRDKFQSFISNN
jgi:protein arginine kinase